MSTSTLDRTHSLIENYSQVRSLLGTYGPASLQDVRDRAMERFAAVGFPSHKDEEFKYTPLRAAEETKYQHAYGATIYREDLEGVSLAKLACPTLAFVNGEFSPELSRDPGLPEGAWMLPLQEALEQHEALVLERLGTIATHEGKLGTTNDERFVWLNTAYLSEGAVVYLPRGVVCEEPIHLLFLNYGDHGPFASHPRVLIIAEESAQAKILESHIGLKGEYLSNSVTELWIDRSANVEHVKYQDETEGAIHLSAVYAQQEGTSTWTSNNVAFGGRIARTDLNVFINGEHTETSLNGAALATGAQIIDNHTRIDHAKANCHSFEVYKTILAGEATGVFNGKIFVYEDAQKTDAKQSNQALLLSPKATMNSKPQLEIFADDVKCTHGATIGQLREDALFYLRSRGIPEAQAQGLLVYAFAAEVLEKIGIEAVKQALEQELFEKLTEETALEAE